MIFRSPYPYIAIPEVPLYQFVSKGFAARSDRAAITDGPSGRTLTYGQIGDGVRRMAVGLAHRGFGKGDVLAIWIPNVPEYAIAILAPTVIGGATTTINPLFTEDECARQLKDTRANYLLTIPQLVDKAQEAVRRSNVGEVFVLGEAPGATPLAALMQNEGELLPVAIAPRTDLATLPFSSGTTGMPKGVMLTHYNLVAQLCQVEVVNRPREGDVAIAVLPFFHIYGMMVVLLNRLRQGVPVVSMPRFDLEQFLGCMQQYRVTRAPLVPPIVLALAKHPLVDKYDLSGLTHIACGAAPLGENVEQACAERLGCIVYQGFGMTEVAGAAIGSDADSGRVKHGSVGVCLPNVEARIVDLGSGRELGPGERGELCVRGPNVMRGYLNQPEATANMLDADGWLRTGDVAYADEDGYFYLVDRVKELVKYKAYQVAPAELEALLISHPAVADAAIIPSPDEEAGEVPKAFVVLKSSATLEELMVWVAERVAPYKKIRHMEIIDNIPRSPAGKILRRVLIERERAGGISRGPSS